MRHLFVFLVLLRCAVAVPGRGRQSGELHRSLSFLDPVATNVTEENRRLEEERRRIEKDEELWKLQKAAEQQRIAEKQKALERDRAQEQERVQREEERLALERGR